ncbi:sodium-dependent bicarbonate transport family permease [Cyanobacterium aponinum AL20118]|uniref:Sodium-dependent bicarbonate transport family permease n=1 Tax=Cyanobacterium aponinum AL20115 TaxID=3090662 RepID=A0AAF1C5G9_9CHRO|nr:sodium-dependent bicarbonate transport family permease [Cyanobacterium aponinum]WPF87039.1 sodium-dependent bicarbonate transport family permease [Cyanobacterium aponinum AL20115]WRL38950.1 sodium-dependent bicarbonate transport family permease [Cyanobacterium aponinum UTEX 3221]
MDFLSNFVSDFIGQLQSPTLGFLIGGMIIAALGSQLQIPDSIYKFIVFMLLIKVGLSGGIAIRKANLGEIFLPALFAVLLGILIVFIARYTLAQLPKIKMVDALATGGLFGAVSGSTLAAGLTALEAQDIEYEAWAAALYPFMDIPALVTAIVMASVYLSKRRNDKEEEFSKVEYVSKQAVAAGDYSSMEYPTTRQEYLSQQRGTPKRVEIWPIVKESLQGSALSALLLGLALGLFTQPESVYESFFNPLFRGLLSILMLIMGMEATARLSELRKVAQWYAVYAFIAPLVHGFIAFGFGMIAHALTGFSLGGVVILAVIACSSSDISGPPTLRAGIPSANPSAYVGSSTAIGTPVAIGIGIPLYIGLAQAIMGG